MNRRKLDEWNDGIAQCDALRADALRRAIRSRGLARRLALWSAQMFGWLAKVGRSWRNRDVNDGGAS